MQRLKHGSLKRISEHTGISKQAICDYVARRKYPGRRRAVELEAATALMGCTVSATKWLLGSKQEIRRILMDYQSAPHDSK